MTALTAEKQMEHIGETKGCADHDHDLVHELSKRLDALWRYDQYIANAENADGKDNLVAFWHDLKQHDQQIVDRLKQLVAKEINEKCF